MAASKILRALMRQFEPHLPKPNPSAFSTSFSNYISKNNLIKPVLQDKKHSIVSIPSDFTSDRHLGNISGNLFTHLMRRDCFGVGCAVREETLPEWKGKLMIVKAVESRMGGRMGEVRGDIFSVDSGTGRRKIVRENALVNESIALGGKWTVVKDTSTSDNNETDLVKVAGKKAAQEAKRCTKDTASTT